MHDKHKAMVPEVQTADSCFSLIGPSSMVYSSRSEEVAHDFGGMLII